jgi:SAF domain
VVAASPVPRRVKQPSWLDVRFVLGIALVLASVVIGARVVAAADHSYRLLAAGRDLAAGTVLRPGDLTTVSAHVPSRGLYVSAADVTGRQLTRPVTAGELLPASALAVAPTLTTVTVPFADTQAPDLRAGERIEVWLSTKTCASVVLLPDTAVQDVSSSGGGSFSSANDQNVTLSLPPALASRVVTALALDGGVLRAGILTGPSQTASTLADLGGCASSSP